MSVNYQPDRNYYDPYSQEFDSRRSQEKREYEDLYNPYKSIWNSALKNKLQPDLAANNMFYKPNEKGRAEYQNVPGYSKANTRSIGFHRLHPRDAAYAAKHSEEDIHDSGFDITSRNTYRNRTTGYGPRD